MRISLMCYLCICGCAVHDMLSICVLQLAQANKVLPVATLFLCVSVSFCEFFNKHRIQQTTRLMGIVNNIYYTVIHKLPDHSNVH